MADNIKPEDVFVTFHEKNYTFLDRFGNKQTKDHVYFDNFGNQYTSGTGLIGPYKFPFDLEGKSRKRAIEQLGGYGTEEEILKMQRNVKGEWELNKNIACMKGTEYHLEKENWVNSLSTFRGLPVITERPHLSKLKDGIYTELVVWNYEYRTAGQADLVIIENGFVDVEDYKTSKEVTMRSKYRNKMKAPIGYLDCCHYNHYSLQTCLYSWMICAATGFKPRRNRIYHTIEDNWIVCADFRREVQLLLKDHQQKRLAA